MHPHQHRRFPWPPLRPPTPPTPEPAPPLRAVLVLVADSNGDYLVDASVTIDDTPPPEGPGPHVGITDGNGQAYFPEVPAALSASQLWIDSADPEYAPYYQHLDLPPDNVQIRVGIPGDPSRPDDVLLPAVPAPAPPEPVPPEPIVPPTPGPRPTWTQAQLMDMQTDLMVWAPEVPLPASIKTKTPSGQTAWGLAMGWHWSVCIDHYPPSDRQRLYAAFTRRGYTHWVLHIAQPTPGGGYHDLIPIDQAYCDSFGARTMVCIDEMEAAGLVPVWAGVAPGAPLAAGMDANRCLVAMSDWDNSDDCDGRIDALGATFPARTLLYFELPSENVVPAGQHPGGGGAYLRGLQQRHPNFVGVLYELDHPEGIATIEAKLDERNAFWRDVQQNLFEIDTYWKFWDNLSDGECVPFNDQLLRDRGWLLGYGSGATAHPVVEVPTDANHIVNNGHDMLPATTPTWVDGPNISSFRQTTAITKIELRTTGVVVEFGKKDGPDRWPDSTTPGWEGALQYSLGMCLCVDGRWGGSAPIEFWYGLKESGGQIQDQNVEGSGVGQIPKNWFYDNRWDFLAGYQPKPGETIGLFVCAGDARNDYCPVKERSNLVLVPLPQDGVATVFVFT